MLKWKSFNREFPREYLLRSSARRGGLFLDCVLDLKTNKSMQSIVLVSLRSLQSPRPWCRLETTDATCAYLLGCPDAPRPVSEVNSVFIPLSCETEVKNALQ